MVTSAPLQSRRWFIYKDTCEIIHWKVNYEWSHHQSTRVALVYNDFLNVMITCFLTSNRLVISAYCYGLLIETKQKSLNMYVVSQDTELYRNAFAIHPLRESCLSKLFNWKFTIALTLFGVKFSPRRWWIRAYLSKCRVETNGSF